MADDWENEDFEPQIAVAAPIPSQWDDEDVDNDNVQESWEALDADEEEDDKKSTSSKTSSTNNDEPKKRKKSLKEILAEKKAEEERKKAELAAKRKQQEAEKNETPEQRKARLENLVKESDFQNAQDLFGGLSVSGKQPSATTDDLMAMNPKTKDDFDKFVKLLVEKTGTFTRSAQYPYFVETLTRQLCDSMDIIDIRKVASSLTALSNEKQKQAKDASKKKKNSAPKATVKVASRGLDMTNYDEVVDDEDDFMGVNATGAEAGGGRFTANDYDDFM